MAALIQGRSSGADLGSGGGDANRLEGRELNHLELFILIPIDPGSAVFVPHGKPGQGAQPYSLH